MTRGRTQHGGCGGWAWRGAEVSGEAHRVESQQAAALSPRKSRLCPQGRAACAWPQAACSPRCIPGRCRTGAFGGCDSVGDVSSSTGINHRVHVTCSPPGLFCALRSQLCVLPARHAPWWAPRSPPPTPASAPFSPRCPRATDAPLTGAQAPHIRCRDGGVCEESSGQQGVCDETPLM